MSDSVLSLLILAPIVVYFVVRLGTAAYYRSRAYYEQQRKQQEHRNGAER